MPKAVATVTDKMFFKGTVILLHSFLSTNPWFKGDVIIMEDDLDQEQREILSAFPNVKWHPVNKYLKTRIDVLTNCMPSYAKVYRKFYSLEIFNIQSYSQILFLDSDVLCTGDISEFFSCQEAAIAVAPDRSYHLNQKREKETFIAYNEVDQNEDKLYYKCFNSGAMLLNFKNIKEGTYNDLLTSLSPLTMSKVLTGHSDQYILNRYFHENNDIQMVSSKFNYLLHNQRAIMRNEGLKLSDALLIHYIKRPKPWLTKKTHLSYELWYKKNQEYENWLKAKSKPLLANLQKFNYPIDSSES